MNRVAWILNLRDPFGAALGRELVSRGWQVIGGDPQAAAGRDAHDGLAASEFTGLEQGREPTSGLPLRQEETVGEGSENASPWKPSAPDAQERSASGGEVHSPKLGENAYIPTGTGSSGFGDFEGSVAYGPESNERRTDGHSGDGRSEEEREHPDAHPGNEDSGAGEDFRIDDPGEQKELGASTAADEMTDAAGDSAAVLAGHGRLRVLPLAAEQPGALEEAARHTAEFAGRIDLLVLNPGESGPAWGEAAGLSAAGADTTEGRLRDYGAYALTPLQAAEQLLPLMEAEGGLKRIGFVSSHEGSVSAGDSSAPIGRAMARTALHMQAKLLFNDLRREGYTFRLYDPGLSPPRPAAPLGGESGSSSSAGEAMVSLPGMAAESARFAAGFFTNPHADEGRLVLTGSRGEEWPF
ncbi:hypothetical protein B9G55_14325 [Saccharibacillus sp. O16]|nr:hypothetical protein B9G55_14325 [Saccharibacillus sp. O16]